LAYLTTLYQLHSIEGLNYTARALSGRRFSEGIFEPRIFRLQIIC